MPNDLMLLNGRVLFDWPDPVGPDLAVQHGTAVDSTNMHIMFVAKTDMKSQNALTSVKTTL